MDFRLFNWLQLDESSFDLPAVCMATMNYGNTGDDDDDDDDYYDDDDEKSFA